MGGRCGGRPFRSCLRNTFQEIWFTVNGMVRKAKEKVLVDYHIIFLHKGYDINAYSRVEDTQIILKNLMPYIYLLNSEMCQLHFYGFLRHLQFPKTHIYFI